MFLKSLHALLFFTRKKVLPDRVPAFLAVVFWRVYVLAKSPGLRGSEAQVNFFYEPSSKVKAGEVLKV